MIAALDALSPTEMALVAAIFVLGGLVKGAMGFGLPLATMAMLPIFVAVETALAVNIVVLLLTNVAQFVQMGDMRATAARFSPVLWGSVAGIPLGAALAAQISDAWLLGALGTAVLVFSALSLGNVALTVPPHRATPIGWGAGILGGAVAVLTTVPGPIYVMYLLGLGVDRRSFLSALSLFFIVTAVLTSGTYMLLGFFTPERLVLTAVAAFPAALLGMWLGNMLTARLSVAGFRSLVLLVLAVLGANLLWRAVLGG